MAQHETIPPAKRRCLSQPLPKHTIFLSHSGNEKPFAEQLCEDLKGMNHDPFFDQDSYSLPKGEKFAPLIFSAAEQCLLAVVVLSEGYLSSKWPMLELSTFVKSMKGGNPSLELFPVFYKLLPSDLSAEKVETRWRESWDKLVQEGTVPAKEIASWSDAVRELRAVTGVDFSNYGTSEVKYRAALVEEICNKVPPIMKYKTDDIRGYERLCEITSRMFQEGYNHLGLYGLGGVGKSTLCKAMCSYMQKVYRMRVCHIELPSNPDEEFSSVGDKGRISRLKYVIQELANFSTRIVDKIVSESPGLDKLQEQLGSQPPVFLAVDNVGDSEISRNEAQGLVKIILATSSKVMVTSRSQAILKSIFGTEGNCKPIPRLEAHEARELFLSVATRKELLCPLKSCEDEIVEACLKECRFAEVGYGTQQFHPLVLIALGIYFYDVDNDSIMEWKEHLPLKNKVQASRHCKHVNAILGLNYFSLSPSMKLIFLDVALLLNAYIRPIGNISCPMEEMKDYKWHLSVLAALHGLHRLQVEMHVKELQRKGLVYESSPTLDMHDLYSEFAQFLVMKQGSEEKEWWGNHKEAVGSEFGLMKRLILDGEDIKYFRDFKQLRQYEKPECLVLDFCTFKDLDVGHLKRLCVLIVHCVGGMVEIVCNREGEGDDGYLPELQFVHLCGNDLTRIPFITHCYNLRFLSIEVQTEKLVEYITSTESKIFEKLQALEVLLLNYLAAEGKVHEEKLISCILSMPSLKLLEIVFDEVEDWYETRRLDVSPLGCLPSLNALSLISSQHEEVQGLNHLCGLTTLNLNSRKVSEFQGVDQLSQLTTLNLNDCESLRVLPNLDLLPNLREVCVYGCCSLEKDSIYILKRYREIWHHNYHKCHQPF